METTATILIIDDDHDIRTVMLYGLESYGFQVKTCENATEAMLTTAVESYDYILTDYDMPGMDGIELVRRLRGMQPKAVIIGMSGKDLGIQFLQAGANDFVQKPFIPHDIVLMIDGGDLRL